jgi:glycosyltransferase involved in cell wall biosynthesis
VSNAKALSIIIPGRNEEFMRHTVDDVLAHTGEETEVIAVCDGYWPEPPLLHHPRLQVLHFGEAIGQRAATNMGAKASRAKYIMKLDAHCSVDEGFDVKLLEKMEPDMTMIPSMHRLHVFDWHCNGCGERVYQGTKPKECAECKGTDFSKIMVWSPRYEYPATVTWRFDKSLHFQYWRGFRKTDRFKAQAPTGIAETMSCIGACFMMDRERFWQLGGMDEGHGSWGQYGTELACKAWLSGGRMVTNLNTWFAHLFRTGNFGQNGESSWPYPINQRDIDAARKHSRELWMNDKWPGAKRPLSWLIEHFAPVPDWH